MDAMRLTSLTAGPTKEKIAYHNGKEYFQLDRPVSAPAGRKATEITKIVEP
jgi:hypothetical protein